MERERGKVRGRRINGEETKHFIQNVKDAITRWLAFVKKREKARRWKLEIEESDSQTIGERSTKKKIDKCIIEKKIQIFFQLTIDGLVAALTRTTVLRLRRI